jgi:Tfp pilus assembly protein FimV
LQEAQRKSIFLQEEKRLLLEKGTRQEQVIEAHVKEQKDKEMQFMMQQYESQLALLNEQLQLKSTELA